MGEITHQYSSGEIVEKYRKHIDDYNNIIVDLNNIMESAYIRRQNIGIFLNFHLRFCVEAVNVLEDAIEAIQNGTVDESICMRLEGLFESCEKEHKDLEDTYSRVNERYTEEFYRYQGIHIRLREVCDAMAYCDETVRFVRAIIPNKSNTNIFYGDVKNVQIQQDTHNSSQKASEVINEVKDTIIEKEKTSFKEILKDKFNEAVVGSVLFIIAAILYKALFNGLFDAIESNVKIFLIVIMIAFFFLGLGLLVICVRDILNILPLFIEGSFVELESKSEWLDKFGEFFRNSEYTMPKDVRATGKCYKNVGGEIYKIKGKICPYCETQPIGKMFLNYSNYSKIYFWECSQNQAHRIEFDYKKKI